MTRQERYANRLISFCDDAIDNIPRTPKGLVFIFEWGSLRALSNVVFICLQVSLEIVSVMSSQSQLFSRQLDWVSTNKNIETLPTSKLI